MTQPDTLDIYGLMVELIRLCGYAPGYQRVWSMAVAARIPAHRRGRRWRFERADVPEIAAKLGLTDQKRAA